MVSAAAQRCALWVGALYAVTILIGAWGESYVPSVLLIGSDVAGTAHRLAGSLGTFRASFAAYLIEACCDITLNILLYALLRPVGRLPALLAVGFGLMATAIYAAGELVYFSAALPAIDSDVARVISPEVKAQVSYLCLTAYGYDFAIFSVFYGIAALIRGYLVWRSGFLPRAIGALFMLGGAGFTVHNFLSVLTPKYDLPYLILPMFMAMIAWLLWVGFRGLDLGKWDDLSSRQPAV